MEVFSAKVRRPFFRRPLVLAILILAAATLLFFELRLGPPPEITVEPDRPGIGRQEPTAIAIAVAEPERGVSRVTVEAVQGERAVMIAEREHEVPRPWAFWRPRTARDEWTVAVGRETFPGLEEGELTLRVSALRAGTWLRRGRPVIEEVALPVRLVPPELSVISEQNYAKQGGSGVVVYRVGETALEDGARDGVEAGGWFFPGRPLPVASEDGEDGEDGGGDGGGASAAHPGDRFALFAVPYDLDTDDEVRVVAVDGLGNRIAKGFLIDLVRVPLRTDTIRIDDAFMGQVVPEVLARTPDLGDRGGLLENYLAINGELRQRNAEELIALAARSTPAFLWSGAFRQLPNSQVTSAFADRRTYVYQGREVDRQDHLGYDLASVRRAPVPASGAGTVMLARYFGIYGNTVVLDHGYGLMSLYSHLSQIDVEEGQAVAQGDVLGRTGTTGLAAGDHLHFTMMIGGLAVDPVEWWDPSWVRNRITAKLENAN